MSSKPLYMCEKEVKEFLKWNTIVPVVESAMADVSRNEVIQPSRIVMPIPSNNGILLAMPAFSKPKNVLACKVVTAFENNKEKKLPSVLATILYMDADTGKVKVIIEGTEITTWRTVAASIVGTKNLHSGEKKVLAILGAGTQGRMHAIAMKEYFNFNQVRIWNRTSVKAQELCKELGSWCTPYESREDCVKGADVIVTATFSESPLVMKNWVKKGAHINAVGAGKVHYSELQLELYRDEGTRMYVDSMSSAQKELKGLLDLGVTFTEVGQIINKERTVPSDAKITIFQGVGMAIEDVVVSQLVYESYLRSKQ